MRILFILTELPFPASRNGVALINHQLLKHAPKDVRIDILIIGSREPSDVVDKLLAIAPVIESIQFTNEPLSRKYRIGNLLSGALLGRNLFTQSGVRNYVRTLSHKIDVVYISPIMIGMDLRLVRPVFLNAIDSLSVFNNNAFRHTGKFRDKIKTVLYKAYERRAFIDASLINFVSFSDMESVRRGNPGLPLLNLSNGIDCTVFTPSEQERVPGRLLFTGNLDYAPNSEAARHLVFEIFPRIRATLPNATLHIVGRNPPPDVIGHPGVVATGFVEDIVAYYRSAEVFVCPMLSGAGVKNKVLEALSAGLPIVTTSLGINGIEYVEEGRHYLLADDPYMFSQKVLSLLMDGALRGILCQQARALALQYLGWQPIVNRYFNAMRKVAITNRGGTV